MPWIKTSINPVSEVETVLISQLRKYLEVSRSEARELIFLLNEMVIKAIGDGLPINGARQRQVDWESIVDALTRLQDE
ncbi:hypothetical protein EC991_005734 [Linnemannia zychae]|nr:hypothetical protein EC991_005734 [Linnemannia zychae]